MYWSPVDQRSRKCEVENESLQTFEFNGRVPASGTRKHRESLPRNSRPPNFRTIIDWLVPPPASQANLVALFDGRANYGMIRHWKYGRAKPPAWAVELACEKLRAQIEPAEKALQRARQWIGADQQAKGAAGAKALAAWRERKARERDEKEVEK